MDLNALKQYMDFFRQNHLGGTDYSAHNGFNPTPFDPNGAALTWATNAMGGNGGQNGGSTNRMPDYFSGASNPAAVSGYQPSQYVPPQQVQGRFQPPQGAQQPITGQVNNFLSQMLRSR